VIVIPTYSCAHLDTSSWRVYHCGTVAGPPCRVSKQPALYMSVNKAVGLSATCCINKHVVLTVKLCEAQWAVYLTGEAGPHKASHCVTRTASKLEQTFPSLGHIKFHKNFFFSSTASRFPRLRCDDVKSLFRREGEWGMEV